MLFKNIMIWRIILRSLHLARYESVEESPGLPDDGAPSRVVPGHVASRDRASTASEGLPTSLAALPEEEDGGPVGLAIDGRIGFFDSLTMISLVISFCRVGACDKLKAGKPLTQREAEEVLKGLGYVFSHARGSHHHWVRAGTIFTLPLHGKDLKKWVTRELRRIYEYEKKK